MNEESMYVIFAFIVILIPLIAMYGDRMKEMFVETCLYDPMVSKLRKEVQGMIDARTTPWTEFLEVLNHRKKDVVQKLKLCKGSSSYTIDKNTTYLCVIDETTGKYYEKNMLMHVFLHELAHVICDEIGHTKMFDNIFKQLMDEAHEFGIYDKYAPLLAEYCGVGKNDTYSVV